MTSEFADGSLGPVPDGAKNGFRFTKICGIDLYGDDLVAANVATFNSCINICGSFNLFTRSTNCTGVSYHSGDGACWVHRGVLDPRSDSSMSAAQLSID